MAKFADDSIMNAALAVADNGTTLHVCSGQPANHAGIAAVSLASVSMTAGSGNGDYTVADGDTSGRKLTVLAQTGLTIASSGTATHIATTDGSTLLLVTTCTSQALVANGSNTVDVPAFDYEVGDPT